MKLIVLILAISAIALSGIIPLTARKILEHTPNPNAVLEQVRFSPLSYCDPTVEVEITQIKIGWHGIALSQYLALYPLYKPYPIHRCRYATLGLTRFYTFTISVGSSEKETTTAIQVADPEESKGSSNADEKQGYAQVSIDWAEKDPKISFALNVVIKSNWNVIKGNPLHTCWQKPLEGSWIFRFYFKNVDGKFEYKSDNSESEGTETDKDYYAEVEPVFVVGEASKYTGFSLVQFKKTTVYPIVVAQLTASLGKFDDKWILSVSISINNGVNYIKVTINFQPFLLKQDYEAQYYGSVEKASLLKIDEKVFNGNGKSFEDWQEIKEFGEFSAFKEASQYALSQFTWLRFYKVVSAYSALRLNGRFVRLVYQGKSQYVDGNNQINIVIFIDECGKYFIDRNDFHATNLNSYGRNNWVSLFIQTPEVSKAQYYQQIVKFYKNIYPKFWSANQLVDIKFKGNLHVVKFQNPTNWCYGVLNVDENKVDVLNNFNWVLLGDNSPLAGRIQNYVRGKYNVDSIMFIQYLKAENGTHFEIGYLDPKGVFHTAYLLYIPANDAFTEDTKGSFSQKSFESDKYIDPVPKDLEGSLVSFLTQDDKELIAVLSYVSLSPRSFAVIGISGGRRWQFIINWVQEKWVVISKQPYNDGFYVATGVPSVSAASCTGFVKKLYPVVFAKNFVYVSIETKSVGVSLSTRIVYNVEGKAFEATVSTTYGVRRSHVLQSYLPVVFVKPSKDYGYGTQNNINYGVDAAELYNQEAKESNLSKESTSPIVATVTPAVVVEDKECPPNCFVFAGQCIPLF